MNEINSNTISVFQKLKEVFKHSLVYGLTSSLQSFLGFILLPILTNYYTTEIFGVYSILLLLSAFASAIFYLGASTALGRFYYEEDSILFRQKMATTSIIVTLVGALLLIILGFIFSDFLSFKLFNSYRYATPIELIFTASALGFLSNLMTLLIRYQKKSMLFFYITMFGIALNFFTTMLLLTRFDFGILAPIYGLLLGNSLCLIILFYININLISFKLEKSHFKKVFIFGIQSSIASLLFYILEWVDRLIIKDLLNLSQVGVYSLGYRLGAIINIIVIMPFSLIWAPIRMQYSNNINSGALTSKVLSYYTIIGVIIIYISILFGKELMLLFFKNKAYADSAAVFPIIMLALLFYGYQNILDYGIYLYKKVYFYIIIALAAIVINISLNLWLIPVYGYIASAFVTLITYVVTSSLVYLISNKYHRITIEWRRVLWPIIFLVASYIFIYYFNCHNILLKLCFLIISLILFILFWLDRKEINYLKTFMKTIEMKGFPFSEKI
jgi:O-antigen/teichoic acid export membrane protein